MSPELSSLKAFYTTAELRNYSKKWIDSYTNFADNFSLLNGFQKTFGMDPAYFGIGDNVHPIMNELMASYYHNEAYIKSSFIRKELLIGHHVTLFEYPISDSRIDLCRVNGRSYAYEIKTEFDNLRRLKKQLGDYLTAFEYVYVICSDDKTQSVLNEVPAEVGVISYSTKNRNPAFIEIRNALYSKKIDSHVQFRALSDKTRRMASAKKPDWGTSEDGREFINCLFKEEIKAHYVKNWCFLKSNLNQIEPLDYQFCFKTMNLSLNRIC
jgi:hypothetical protein